MDDRSPVDGTGLRPDRAEGPADAMSGRPCPFCREVDAGEPDGAVDGDVDSALVAVLADRFPVTAGHLLIVPRMHVADLFALPDDVYAALFAETRRQARRIVAGDRTVVGFNVGVNVGAAAGQTVGHVHVHLIPRRVGDVDDPRGGVRWVVPGRARYWA